ncbi:amino acid permease [Lophiotrema nucula]|uniref:Amino acid permease n=1 Tax=Lophiotrema nucula TaxID=690887 RepID=A0A6A5Z646_9PLEO|nr:amino acid permease [Lophiotrema nucula]
MADYNKSPEVKDDTHRVEGSESPRDHDYSEEAPGMAEFAPLHRKLKSRHLQMIAIGGIIGPGLLVGSGNALRLAGPAGILISFSLVGIIVFFVMQSLGELATVIPVSGSFIDYATRFFDPALSFALGWAYWYLWLTVLANEYNAISLVWGWILIFWALFISLSMLGVLAYGEVEFWLSLIKVISISIFFILAIAISAGGVGPQKIGFKYWNNPGAFADSINGVARTFVIAGTLYAGTEMVGITAGESANPKRAVPRAIKQVFWRILVFYVGMMFFIGILIPYTDPRLLGKGSKTAASPLTIALADARIAPAAHLINALIVISVISAGNSSLYVASRTITHMARNGMAPKFLGKADKRGVPWAALLFTNIFACIAFLSQSSSAVQGQRVEDLPFRALWYPWGTYSCLAANIFLIFFQGYTCFLNPFSGQDFVINYILLPVFVTFYFGYKFWHKTTIVKAEDIDIWTGRRDDLSPPKDKSEKKSIWRRVREVVIG